MNSKFPAFRSIHEIAAPIEPVFIQYPETASAPPNRVAGMNRTSQKSDNADAPQSRTANPAKNKAESGTNCPPIATLLQLLSKQKPTLLIAPAESHAAAH